MYYVITCSDGDVTIHEYSKQELASVLKEMVEEINRKVNIFSSFPGDDWKSTDPNYWPENSVLIIKGSIFGGP